MGSMTDADMAQMREKLIDKAGRELLLDDSQQAKLGSPPDLARARSAALARLGISGRLGSAHRAGLCLPAAAVSPAGRHSRRCAALRCAPVALNALVRELVAQQFAGRDIPCELDSALP